LPTQLGYHFWPAFSLVIGRRIDYLSPTIFITDILAILVIIFGLLIYKKELIIFLKKHVHWAFGIGILVIFNIVLSPILQLAFYGWLQIVELMLLGIIFYFHKIELKDLIYPLGISVAVSISLALQQFLLGHSLGGAWYFLGERTFSLDTPQIAALTVNGRLLLRPYGTFPHPNVLGGFCLSIIPLFFYFKPQSKPEHFLKYATIFMLSFGIILSFSRSVWLVSGIVLLLYFLKMQKRLFTAFLIIVGIVVIEELTLGRFGSLMSVDSQSIGERQSLTFSAVQLFASHPLFGVGLLNSIPLLPTITRSPFLLQPVHSLPLLILSESGLIGFLLAGYFLIKTLVKSFKKPFLTLSLVSILLLGLFDHFFLTIQQTQLILPIVLSLIWSSSP
jgi:hypothetical protein